MPRRIPEPEFEAILAAIARFPDGTALDRIHETLEIQLPRRTLQRRLATLAEQGRITVRGRGRATRYQRAPVTAAGQITLPALEVRGYAETYVPTTAEGDAVRRLVRQPLQARQPVGYKREFLDAYRPNATWYLTDAHRTRLLEMGRYVCTPDRQAAVDRSVLELEPTRGQYLFAPGDGATAGDGRERRRQGRARGPES
jgi:hypothetical protein